MSIAELRILLRIEAKLADVLEDLRNVIAIELIDIEDDQPEPRRQTPSVDALTAAE
jgi:hypothetical protein